MALTSNEPAVPLLDPRVVFDTTSGTHYLPDGRLCYLMDTDLIQNFTFIGVTHFQDGPNGNPRGGLVTSYNWNGEQDLVEYFNDIEAKVGASFPQETVDAIISQVTDFLEYRKSVKFLSIDLAEATPSVGAALYSDERLIRDEPFYEGEDDEVDADDYDASTCEACGGINTSDMSGALYEANSKYDAVLVFHGMEVCDSAVEIAEHPLSGREELLDYLSIYRGKYSQIEEFCVAVEAFK